MEPDDADLRRARLLATAASALAIAGALLVVVLCFGMREPGAIAGVPILVFLLRLCTKEIGRHRATAVLGCAVPTAVAIGLLWTLLAVGNRQSSQFDVLIVVTLLIVALLAAATVCAAAVPSGTIPPDLRPGSSVLVHHPDGNYYPGRAGPMQNGYVYVYFNHGAGDWVPRQYVRVKA